MAAGPCAACFPAASDIRPCCTGSSSSFTSVINLIQLLRISERPSYKATFGSPEVMNMAKEMTEKKAAAKE
jgi:hypothetical protein